VRSAEEVLRAGLIRARDLGFLGPGAVDSHLRHADGFARVARIHGGDTPERYLDLGSGAGIPGLVLAARWRDTRTVLVESMHRRANHLRHEHAALMLGPAVEILEERAEVTARRPSYRERHQVVTARAFGTPPVVAEIAAGLVEVGGIVIVSEPPVSDVSRWPREPLAELGLGPAHVCIANDAHFAVLRKDRPAPDHMPRRVGIPAKRPGW
jgi:16S rRNA (guanine527-N7)-methyltransferase